MIINEASRRKVKENKEDKMSLVIILRGTEGEPKRRLAPARARVTGCEIVGEVKYDRQW